MRYARRMNGYSEVPHNGEINNYLRKDLDAKATAKNTACWNLLGKVRTKRTLWGCGCFFGRSGGQSKTSAVLHGAHPVQ